MQAVPPNDILEFALNGEFEHGWREYAKLGQPSPVDDRWGAACLMFLGKLQAAERLLTQAVNRGYIAARIELAGIRRLMGQASLGRELLESLEGARHEPRAPDALPDGWGAASLGPLDCLDRFDEALLQREWGIAQHNAGDLRAACLTFERAWAVAQKTRQGRAVASSIDQLWAEAFLTLGRLCEADEHLVRACASASQPRHAILMAVRARLDLMRGDLSAAESHARSALRLARAYSLPSPEASLVLVCVHAARGSLALAARDIAGVIDAAAASGAADLELKARLLAATVEAQRENFGLANAHLVGCERLERSPWDEGLVALRRGAMLVRRDDVLALDDLNAALSVFTRLNLPRESGWTRLHLAEAHLTASDAAAAKVELEAALACRQAMGDGMPLMHELALLPRAQAALSGPLAEDWRSYAGRVACARRRVTMKIASGPPN